MRITLCFGLILSILTWPISAHALDPAYLDEMPEVSRVLADMQGTDQADTYARQSGATHHLTEIVLTMAGERSRKNKLTDDEHRIASAYSNESARIHDEVRNSPNPKNQNKVNYYLDWTYQFGAYRNDAQFLNEILQRYFSPEFRAQYQQTVADASAPPTFDYQPSSGRDYGFFGRWGKLAPDQQTFVLQLGFSMFVVLMLVLTAEFLPFDIHPNDPHKLRAGLRRYRIDWITGVLTNYRTEKASETSSYFLRYNPANVLPGQPAGKQMTSTTSYLYEKFSLVNENAQEEVTTVKSKSGSISTGSGYFRDKVDREISAAWVSRRNGEYVGHLLFYDWIPELEIAEQNRSGTISKLRSNKGWSSIAALLLGFAIAVPSHIPLARIWVPIVAWIVWRMVFWAVRGMRNRRFEAQVLPRLSPHLRD